MVEGSFESLYLETLDGSWGGVVFEVCLFVYCFIGLALICDDYLVPSLEVLCVRWAIREDVAGASFMAFGSAAPEIIVNAISTLKAANQSVDSVNLGLGAILGSSVIAFSLIPGSCALVSDKEMILKLKRRPLLRDILTYCTALGLLVSAFHDHEITLGESSTLLVLYGVYGLVVFFAPMVREMYHVHYLERSIVERTSFVVRQEEFNQERLKKKKKRLSQQRSASTLASDRSSSGRGLESYSSFQDDEEQEIEHLASRINANNRHSMSAPLPIRASSAAASSSYQNGASVGHDDDGEDDREPTIITSLLESHAEDPNFNYEDDGDHQSELGYDEIMHLRDSSDFEMDLEKRLPIMAHVMKILTCPLRMMIKYTCPKAERGTQLEWLYPLSFCISFCWVAVFSFVISAVVERWGDLTNVPLSFFGFFLVSLGAEVPDTIQSVTVAKRGYGSMAVSNAIGSQICNICVGLGLPWTLSLLSGRTIRVTDANHLLVASVLQFCNIACVLILLFGPVLIYRQEKAKLSRKKGYVLISMYLIIVVSYATTTAL